MFPSKDSITVSRFPLYRFFSCSEYYQLIRLLTPHQPVLDFSDLETRMHQHDARRQVSRVHTQPLVYMLQVRTPEVLRRLIKTQLSFCLPSGHISVDHLLARNIGANFLSLSLRPVNGSVYASCILFEIRIFSLLFYIPPPYTQDSIPDC